MQWRLTIALGHVGCTPKGRGRAVDAGVSEAPERSAERHRASERKGENDDSNRAKPCSGSRPHLPCLPCNPGKQDGFDVGDVAQPGIQRLADESLIQDDRQDGGCRHHDTVRALDLVTG